jgi:hypothetical protein
MALLMAQSSINGPVEGFIFDRPTKSLRAVIGSLGSASLGPAVLEGLDYGSVAPRQDYGLAFRDGRCLVVSGLRAADVAVVELPGQCAVPEGIAWSGDSSVAVLYSRTDNWIQTVKDLPASPQSSTALNASLLGGSLSAVAAGPRGENIAIATVGETAGVFQIAGGLSFVPLLTLSRPVALAFSDDGAKLYALDGAANQISEVSMADSTSQVWPLDGLADPIALRYGHDDALRQMIYVAGRGDQLLVAYDALSHEVITSLALGFEPSVVDALGRDSFLLRPRANSGEPLWSFKNAGPPAVYFIPAGPFVSREDAGR